MLNYRQRPNGQIRLHLPLWRSKFPVGRDAPSCRLAHLAPRQVCAFLLAMVSELTCPVHLEYNQALAFDQLYNIMRNGKFFFGFHEAPINFPPTFKYDVLRKHHKRRNKHHSFVNGEGLSPDAHVGEMCERRPGSRGSSDDDPEHEEAASMVSTGTTFSRRTGDEIDDDEDEDDDGYFDASRHHDNAYGGKAAKDLVKRLSVTAAHKAKVKILELVSHPSANPIPKWTVRRSIRRPHGDANSHPSSLPASPPMHSNGVSSPIAIPPSKSAGDHHNPSHSPTSGGRPSSMKSGVHSTVDELDDDADVDIGVYDSSSKQRVPSW